MAKATKKDFTPADFNDGPKVVSVPTTIPTHATMKSINVPQGTVHMTVTEPGKEAYEMYLNPKGADSFKAFHEAEGWVVEIDEKKKK